MTAEFVEPAAAWTTAWPAWLAAVAMVVALVHRRRQILPRREWWLPALGVVFLALLVRFVWLPVPQEHVFDGHEADYLDFFLGQRSPSRGGTVLYPAMQWLYWLAGKALSGAGWLLVISASAAMLSIAAAAGLAGRLFGGRAALWTGSLLALYGNHAFWSSSAYNVMIPLALSLVFLWALLRAQEAGGLGFSLLAASAGMLAVATRLESAVVIVPALLLVLRQPPRPLWKHLAVLAAGAGLALAAVLPLLLPGGMPGEGEWAFMWPINIGLVDFLAPWCGAWLLPLVVVAWLPEPEPGNRLRRRGLSRGGVLAMLAWALAVHAVMAAFDDYGYRHALPAGVALAILAGGVLGALRRGPALAVGLTLLLLHGLETQRIAGFYYASEEAYVDALPPGLPRLSVQERPECTLVSEEHRVVGDDQLSHFNLLDPGEALRLRERGQGCLQWCPDLQDWRWNSRSVRDRALRTLHLYPAVPIAVLTHEESGYACLLLDLGPRRTPTEAWFAPVRW